MLQHTIDDDQYGVGNSNRGLVFAAPGSYPVVLNALVLTTEVKPGDVDNLIQWHAGDIVVPIPLPPPGNSGETRFSGMLRSRSD
ncbi:MAG: hypothetical protein QHH75_12935 [Bacillota bacterium]|jgi:hypothetical protein|nr:hypothetical protein [Bacillota bacterium]